MPDLRLSARTTFGASWAGGLQETTSASIDQRLGIAEPPREDSSKDPDEDDRELATAFDRVCEDGPLREMLIDVLNACVPFLSGPLYVGLASNLQQRLRQHADAIDGMRRRHRSAEERAALLQADSSFAARAVGAGFSGDTLEVWCVPVPDAMPTSDDSMLRATEFFLNRWHRPPFGRR